jgi:hypothetical protein
MMSGLLILAASVALLAGCSGGEDRPLSFAPHIYRGTTPPPLTSAQVSELQERGKLQR